MKQKIKISKEDKEKAENGDKIKVDTTANPIHVEWFYDDDQDGNPDDPNNPIGEGKEYEVKCPDESDETHNDKGHTIIGVITQDKKPDGTDYPEGEAPTITTKPVKVEGDLPKEIEVQVIVVAGGIRREGDKKKDIYELMQKLMKAGLLDDN